MQGLTSVDKTTSVGNYSNVLKNRKPEAAMTFDEAINILGRDERFRAAVYAMNTLLQQKGIYSASEFEHYFCQHAENEVGRQRAKSASEISSGAASAIR